MLLYKMYMWMSTCQYTNMINMSSRMAVKKVKSRWYIFEYVKSSIIHYHDHICTYIYKDTYRDSLIQYLWRPLAKHPHIRGDHAPSDCHQNSYQPVGWPSPKEWAMIVEAVLMKMYQPLFNQYSTNIQPLSTSIDHGWPWRIINHSSTSIRLSTAIDHGSPPSADASSQFWSAPSYPCIQHQWPS